MRAGATILQGVYRGLSTASEVFLIFTTQLYQYLSVIFLFAPVSDEPEVFLPKYSQTAIPHAAHFRWVVKYLYVICCSLLPLLNTPRAFEVSLGRCSIVTGVPHLLTRCHRFTSES